MFRSVRNNCRLRCARPRMISLEDRVTPVVVTWDGGGGDANWSTLANWSTNKLPGMDDDVELIASVGTVVYNGAATTIKSLKLADSLHLQSGSINATNGLTVPVLSTLYADGAAVSFSASGAIDIGSGSVQALAGATITLNGLTTLNNQHAAYVLANGVGSQVNLPDLAQVNNSSFYRYFQAYAGGQINLPELTTLNGGYFELRADDPSSLIKADKLTTIINPPTVPNYIIAEDGGQVQVSSSLTKLEQVYLYVEGTGFPTQQLTSLKKSNLFVVGGTPSFAALSDLDRTSVSVSNGSIVSFPLVTTLPDSDIGAIYFDALDPGASLDFPNLVTVNNLSARFHFRAFSDSSIALTKVTTLSQGSSELLAHDNAFIAAPNLTSISPPSGGFSYIRATSGGGISVAPTLTSLTRTQLEVNGTGFPTAQLTAFNQSNLFVTGDGPSFPALTNIDSSSIAVSGAATVSFSGVSSIGMTDGQEPYFDSSDLGSVLSFPNLTNVAAQNPARIHFRASYSAVLQLPMLTSIAAGNSELRAIQNGMISAPMLNAISPPVGSYSYIGAYDGGQVNVGPSVTTLDRILLEVGGSGFNTGVLTAINHGEVYVYSGSPSFANLTNLDHSSLRVYYGSVVSLPGITSIGASDSSSTYFDSGYGASLLTFPNLVAVAKQDPYRIHFRAIAGGTLTLDQLTSLSAGNAQLFAGSNSTMAAPQLTSFSPPAGSTSFITSTATSSIQVNAALTTLDRVQMEVDRPAAFPLGQLTEFTRGIFYGYGGVLDLPLVTKIDGSSFYIYNDCTTTLAGVTSVGISDAGNVVFQANLSNSVLNLPNLTTMTADPSYFTHIRSYNGGLVAMPALSKFDSGALNIEAVNNAKLNLSSLNELTIPVSTIGYLYVYDNSELDSASTLSLFNIDMFFNSTSTFDFADLIINTKSLVTGHGTLQANVTNGGEMRPGGAFVANTITIDGNFTQTSGGRLWVDIGGTTPGTLHDQIVVTGQAQLDGTVNVYTILGFQPSVGQSFPVVTFASRMGNFTGYSGLDVGNNVELVPVHGMTDFRFDAVTSTGAIVTGFLPTGTIPGPVNYLEVTFSEAIQAGSVDEMDVQLTGPGGPYTLGSVFQFTANIIRIFFTTPITANGVYNVTLGPGILDLANNPMNQNGMAPDGEVPGDQYANTFTINTADLSIDSFTGVPASANFGQTLNLSWTVRNSGAIPASGQWTDRIWLSTDNKVDFGDVFLGDKLSTGIPMPVNGTYMANLSVPLPTMPANPDGPYFILLQTDVFGQLAEADEMNNVAASATTLANPPRVTQIIVNDGDPQRSRVNSLTVVFSELVSFTPNAAAAFGLARIGPGFPTGAVALATPVVDNGSGFTKVALSFMSGSAFQFGSLIDGNYQLTINAAAISDGSQTLDGNGDGAVGDNSTFDFFRLFGDSNGDRNVTAVDFNQFRLAYGQGPSIFDSDGDGTTTAADFNAFRLRYGVFLSP